tara:strand:- start:228 stop:518 length:291 start_codon:yes stop_codon:yes gene_type:complete
MALKKVHRHDDARVCGATTIATDHKVFANNKLIAVNGDVNSHGGGALVAGSNNVYAGGKKVVNHTPDGSAADSLCPLAPHCAPVTAAGSPDVFVGD